MTTEQQAELERIAWEDGAIRRTLARLGYDAAELPAPAGTPFRFSIVQAAGLAPALDAIERSERDDPDRAPVVVVPDAGRGDFVLVRLEDCPGNFFRPK